MSVVYDTILSAIHNNLVCFIFSFYVVYDTILSAIHNLDAYAVKIVRLYMIRFCQLFTTVRHRKNEFR